MDLLTNVLMNNHQQAGNMAAPHNRSLTP